MTTAKGSPPRRFRRLAAPILGIGILLAAGCGKKGPPLPPLKRGPDRMRSVSARQEGKDVVIHGLFPEKSQDGGPLAPIEEVRVFRVDRNVVSGSFSASSKTAQRTAARAFSREAKRIATVSGEPLRKALVERRFDFQDPAPASGSIPETGKEFTYALTVVDAEKRSSLPSALILIRLLPPPPPPANPQAELFEKRIVLHWEPPGSAHGTLLYNVYRSEGSESAPVQLRNEKPLSQPSFEEGAFAFGQSYFYRVRTVLVVQGTSRESEDSAPVSVSPVDRYAPAVPTGLAVTAEEGVLKLYWFPNGETDLGGYRIYRSEKEDGGFEFLDRVGAGESSYVDRAVKPGVKYYYCITAEDTAQPPNESERSEVHGDRLPPVNPSSKKKNGRR